MYHTTSLPNLGFLSLLSFAWVAAGLSPNVSVPGVTTSAGTIQGTLCNTTSARAYLSIPYAQAPVDGLRWLPPQPYNQSYPGGTYYATNKAPNCVQFGREYLESGPSSEDCLYLDIWAPSNATSTSSLPVQVWIYGGGETAGSISDPLYSGCNIAVQDTVLVSLNYRLGPLGFLALPSAGIHGNFAIQDILLALRWVQSNIAAFGGNPSKVVLFGQSAGAVNAFTISTLDEAPSLMNGVILQSGGGRDLGFNTSIQTSGANYAHKLNCNETDISCLRSKSISELNASLPSTTDSGAGTSNFAAYVDGDIIPVEPSVAGVKVPAIFGSNSDDGSLSTLLEYGLPTTLNATTYNAFLQKTFGNQSSLVSQAYPLSAFNSTPYPAYSAIVTVLTHESFFCPAYRGLNVALQKGIPSYTYLWSHSPSCPWYADIPAAALDILGATHTSEIPFVFGAMYGSPLPNGKCNFTSAERDLSAFMVRAWRSVAENGNPGPAWPAFGNRSLGIIFGNSTSAGVVDYSACALFDKIDATTLAQAEASNTSSSATNGGNSSRGSGGQEQSRAGLYASAGSAQYLLGAGLLLSLSLLL